MNSRSPIHRVLAKIIAILAIFILPWYIVEYLNTPSCPPIELPAKDSVFPETQFLQGDTLDSTNSILKKEQPFDHERPKGKGYKEYEGSIAQPKEQGVRAHP